MGHSITFSKRHRVFDAKNNEELATGYNQWAKNYEQEIEDYTAPHHVMNVLLNYVNKNAKILDAGCGTGLVGKKLKENGYLHLEGLDFSTGMLEEARKKDCYLALYQKVLGEPLDFPTNTFDAVLGVGIFAYAHVPSHSLDELIRITRPQGYLIFTLRPEFYQNSDFKKKMSHLEESGQWKRIEVGVPFQGTPREEPNFYMQVWVYQIFSFD